MGVLDQISQMKSQGIGDEEIIRKLQEQGIPPKAINDALNQAEIKKAVAGEELGYEGSPEYGASQPQAQYIPPQESYAPGTEYAQQPQQQGEYYEEYQPQQGSDSGNYQPAGIDTSTVMEIADQVFTEKTQKMQKQIRELTEFKTISEAKIENFAERLKKIESIIDKLEIAILEKVGSYGRNLETIKKEMSMRKDSFGKMIPSMAARHHTTHESHEKHEPKKRPVAA